MYSLGFVRSSNDETKLIDVYSAFVVFHDSQIEDVDITDIAIQLSLAHIQKTRVSSATV